MVCWCGCEGGLVETVLLNNEHQFLIGQGAYSTVGIVEIDWTAIG